MHILDFLILSCIFYSAFSAQNRTDVPGVAITVYNDNFGVVRDTRQMSFDAGINTIKLGYKVGVQKRVQKFCTFL